LWELVFIPEAIQDIDKLDGSVRNQVLKGIYKVSQNPLPKNKGGYGEPLGNKQNLHLSGLFKIKFRDVGIRVVYSLQEIENKMTVIVVSVREDYKVYEEAEKRRKKF
jgi:mRNA interferase RelE/StbE